VSARLVDAIALGAQRIRERATGAVPGDDACGQEHLRSELVDQRANTEASAVPRITTSAIPMTIAASIPIVPAQSIA
jgi:hypothetical protein